MRISGKQSSLGVAVTAYPDVVSAPAEAMDVGVATVDHLVEVAAAVVVATEVAAATEVALVRLVVVVAEAVDAATAVRHAMVVAVAAETVVRPARVMLPLWRSTPRMVTSVEDVAATNVVQHGWTAVVWLTHAVSAVATMSVTAHVPTRVPVAVWSVFDPRGR